MGEYDNTGNWGRDKAAERYSGNSVPPRTASERIKNSLGMGSKSTFNPGNPQPIPQEDRDALSNMAKKRGGRS